MAITEIASLDQVKSYLRIPSTNTTDDTVLETIFLPAAQQVIEREIGPVVRREVRGERHSGGSYLIQLRVRPVLFVENVQEGWGYFNYDLDDQTVNSPPDIQSIWAYSLDRPRTGIVTRRGPANVNLAFMWGVNNVRVDYVAGRETVPPSATIAFLELIRFWYQTSQLRSANQPTTGFNANGLNLQTVRTDGSAAVAFGEPPEIIEMLKAEKLEPIIA